MNTLNPLYTDGRTENMKSEWTGDLRILEPRGIKRLSFRDELKQNK